MSVQIAIYNPETGNILRRVVCSGSVASLQARSGEAILYVDREIIFNDATHYVDLSGEQPVLAEVP